ncbi:UNVERIFIED_CONTAM: hypothetical protein FKN15_063924 [Acipenser sinensis]
MAVSSPVTVVSGAIAGSSGVPSGNSGWGMRGGAWQDQDVPQGQWCPSYTGPGLLPCGVGGRAASEARQRRRMCPSHPQRQQMRGSV